MHPGARLTPDSISAEEYKRLLEAMADGFVVQDDAGRIISCNAAAQRILGLSVDQMNGRTSVDPRWRAIHEDGSEFPGDEHPAMLSLRTGRPQRDVIMGVHKPDESLTWISIDTSPLIVAGGHAPYGVISTFQDLTERRRAEALLRHSYAELMDLYNNAPCGYHSLDSNGVFVRINDTELRWLGLEREDVIGKMRFADVLAPRDAQLIEQGFERFVKEGDVRNVEVELAPPGVDPMHVLVHATALRDAAGQFIASRTTLYDITQRKRMEEDTRRMNQILEGRVAERTAALKGAVQELEAFASSVSHDLRAPVRAIDAFAQLIETEHALQLDEEGRSLFARLVAANRRQGHLIDDLLSLSRVLTSPLTRQQIDLSAIARAALDDLAQAQPRPALKFTVSSELTAWADPGLMRIAMDNLLGNAWKFTGRTPEPCIEVGSISSGEETQYFVRDNGVGFDAAHATDLFRPFHRMHRDSDFAGTGIGLATVQRIIVRHQGRIWIESAESKGATVFFTLGAEHASN